VISLITDAFLPRYRRRPLAFIKTERRCKKNGEKRVGVDDFEVLLLTFFPIKLLFSVRSDISNHRPNYAPPPPPLARMY
jgi:hypothetical protein